MKPEILKTCQNLIFLSLFKIVFVSSNRYFSTTCHALILVGHFHFFQDQPGHLFEFFQPAPTSPSVVSPAQSAASGSGISGPEISIGLPPPDERSSGGGKLPTTIVPQTSRNVGFFPSDLNDFAQEHADLFIILIFATYEKCPKY